MNLDKRDRLVLFTLLSVAILFTILFYLDLNRKISIGDREVVGTIFFKNNIVQRKFEDEVIWEKLENNSALTNKDTIRSEAFSDALIRLKDGTEINIDENSMFNLDLTGEEPNLEFTQGSLEVKKNDSQKSQIKITSSGSEINVDSGNVKIERSKERDLSLFVEKGKTTIKEKDGKSVSVEEGKKAEFKKTGIEIKKIPVALVAPTSQKLFYAEPEEVTVHFRWKVESGYEDPVLEISRSPNFQLTFINEKVEGTQADLRLKEGTFYWRIKVKSKSGNGNEFSEVNKFFVAKMESFQGESPEQGTIIPYVQTFPLVTLTWTKLSTTNSYKLVISNSPKLTNPVKELETTANQISYDDLKEGTYYWKVIGKSSFPDTKDRESQTLSFTIKKQNSIPAPKWLRPTPNSEISADEIKQNQAILIWDGNAELKSYQLKIFKDPKLGNVVFSEETASNFLVPNWNLLGKGTLYATVIGKSKEGKETESSTVLSFTLVDKKKIPEPEVEPKDNKLTKSEPKLEMMSPNGTIVQMKGKTSLDFQWKVSGVTGERYDLVLYQHSGDKKTAIYKISTKDFKHSLKDLSILDEGSFSWDLSVYKDSSLLLSRKGSFILALDQLKSLKPSDIEFISPKRLYKEKR
ncbi:FecR family protein [Leptospira sp. 2 VSF19]|uniref:FecR family protein n=1 Tax=Leptospira soteropolitanensis TaxID=2950025 RepID=A0AAW5VJH0_9LEPT|nr:FecR domain-containing protein [Leptospira soteropolitanensis]MCW7494053.1 FecR family protein [Leptospira soteropolitanensis]MCW7501681.1 FecR family protein [Leptospira soteropolitanensis]MCW7523899.1 FecR family protein [Leptospira soteropolitanensis]MCW7527764.1 FecR family protein [Leptospira soteropolitanensis]MCW7531651.1 FecR family protein [Leptospira soteropolitanensis]